ncbi:D-alanyl-D-alanine carboxypeptidase [Synechococcus sp. PCC 7336]|uniref:D-alanyl-D-alanine carboxypeptidase n=1 Tax=Synechococcus sp. PCC 7336 TaxID=195250 RepID=UPI000362D7EF|nr:D-alanyl-D-alanine carboxypeptidase [Synechococcus sp. PCC 7336]
MVAQQRKTIDAGRNPLPFSNDGGCPVNSDMGRAIRGGEADMRWIWIGTVGVGLAAVAGLLGWGASPTPWVRSAEFPPAEQPTVERLVSPPSVSAEDLPPVSPAYRAAVNRFLDRLQARGFDRTWQGVLFVDARGRELAVHQPTLMLPAASVTKLATSLAALETWEPNHRFTTKIYATGELREDVLYGDLIVAGDGDPYFVWEDSFELGSQIGALGIRHIAGDFQVVTPFYMNFYPNLSTSAELLRWGMHESLWPLEARHQFQQWASDRANVRAPAVSFSGGIQTLAALPPEAQPLFEHPSRSLTEILKALNTYSNNVMADMLANRLGGISVLSDKVSPYLPAREMQVVTASGLGRDNRFSARAVVAILQALDERAAAGGLSLHDWLPVSGIDPGTLSNRNVPHGIAAKTGTLNSVTTLAGTLPDGTYFVLLNQGWDIYAVRQLQSQLLREMLQVSVDLNSPQAHASP